MKVTNEDRYHLQVALDENIGREHSATMMELLPPVGWAEVATKHDLDQLEKRLELRFTTDLTQLESGIRADMAAMETGIRADMLDIGSGLTGSINELRVALSDGLLKMQYRMFGAIIALVGVLVAAAGLVLTQA